MNDRPNIPHRDTRPLVPIINGEVILVGPEPGTPLPLSPEAVRLILAWQSQADRTFWMVDLIHMARDPEGPKDREANLKAREAALSLRDIGQALGVSIFRADPFQKHIWVAPVRFVIEEGQLSDMPGTPEVPETHAIQEVPSSQPTPASGQTPPYEIIVELPPFVETQELAVEKDQKTDTALEATSTISDELQPDEVPVVQLEVLGEELAPEVEPQEPAPEQIIVEASPEKTVALEVCDIPQSTLKKLAQIMAHLNNNALYKSLKRLERVGYDKPEVEGRLNTMLAQYIEVGLACLKPASSENQPVHSARTVEEMAAALRIRTEQYGTEIHAIVEQYRPWRILTNRQLESFGLESAIAACLISTQQPDNFQPLLENAMRQAVTTKLVDAAQSGHLQPRQQLQIADIKRHTRYLDRERTKPDNTYIAGMTNLPVEYIQLLQGVMQCIAMDSD